jgi:dihydroorotase
MILKNVTINGEYIKNIIIKNGIIEDITDVNNDINDDEVINLDKKIVIPGVIDPHVHVRDLEQKYKEDWSSFTEAAFRGGVTAVFDMPNNKPPIDCIENLNLKIKAAENSKLNKFFVFGANGKNNDELLKIKDLNYVPAIKLFMSYTSSNDLVNSKEDIKAIFQISKEINKVLILHCESEEIIKANSNNYEHIIENHNKIRSKEAAIEATKLAIEIAKEVGNKICIAHVSTAEEIKLIRQAKLDGVKVFCETTPHHFLLSDEVLQKFHNFAKVNPPIRTKEDNEAIYQGLLDGTVDYIGTDHAPHSIEEKLNEYDLSPSGFPGVETLVPLLLNQVTKAKLSLQRVIDLTSHNASRIYKLNNFGIIKKGIPANVTVIDLYKKGVINAKEFKSKAKYSPFDGYEYQGDVILTIVNGEVVYKNL